MPNMHTGFFRNLVLLLVLLFPAPARPASSPDSIFEPVGSLRLTSHDGVGNISGNQMVMSDKRLYLLDHRDKSRFYGVDVSDPAHPAQLFELQLDSGYHTLFVYHACAFISGGTTNLVVDLGGSNPVVRNCAVTGSIVAMQGNLLVSYKNHSVYFWDISNPLSPTQLSSLANITYGSIQNWVFCGRILLTDLAIINVSNPRAPTFTKTGTPAFYQEVHGTTGYRLSSYYSRSNPYALGNTRKHGFFIDDLSIPKHPQFIGKFAFMDPSMFAIDGSIAFVAADDGLHAVDIANPRSIGFVSGHYRLPSFSGAIAAGGNLVHVFDSENHAVYILRYTGERPAMAPEHDAELVQAPSSVTLAADQATTIAVTLRNTGSSSWGENLDYKLAVNEDPGHLGPTRVNLKSGQTIKPGETYTFIVPIRATDQTGDYTMELQMIHEFVARFGSKVNVAVKVTSAAKNTAKDWALLE